MDLLNQLFATFKVHAEVFHNGQYCGTFAVDTSGHNQISFHIVSYGECYLSVGDDKAVTKLHQGDVVLLPRDSAHVVTSDATLAEPANQRQSISFSEGLRDDGVGLVCGYFCHQHPMMANLVEQLPEYIVVRHQAEDRSGLSLLIEALMAESLLGSDSSEMVLSRLSDAILAIILRDHLPQQTGILAALLHPRLRKAVEQFHQSPDAKWSVDLLAQHSHMSRAAFAQLFKQLTQLTPMEYVTNWRMAQAYRMLEDDKVSVLSAALTVGYDNESSFSKAFKREFGVSPGAVRQS